jgi:hypothetical protein
MDRDDMLMAKLVVERGWISKEALEACVQEQAGVDAAGSTVGRKSARPLGVVLVSRRLITDRQLVDLMEEVRRLRGPDAPTPRPVGLKPIGEILVDLGMLTRGRLDEALADQRRGGARRRIGEILAGLGYVTHAQIIEALRRQDKTVMGCAGCGTYFNVVGYRPWVQYKCKKCGSLLEMSLDRTGVSDSTTTVSSVRDQDTPPEVQQAAKDPQAHFGRFVIVQEIVRGPFGPLYRCWQKDACGFVGLIFIPPALGRWAGRSRSCSSWASTTAGATCPSRCSSPLHRARRASIA